MTRDGAEAKAACPSRGPGTQSNALQGNCSEAGSAETAALRGEGRCPRNHDQSETPFSLAGALTWPVFRLQLRVLWPGDPELAKIDGGAFLRWLQETEAARERGELSAAACQAEVQLPPQPVPLSTPSP